MLKKLSKCYLSSFNWLILFFSFLHLHHRQHLQHQCACWKPSKSYIYTIVFESINCSFTFRSHVLDCWNVSLWVYSCLYFLQRKHLSQSITDSVSTLKYWHIDKNAFQDTHLSILNIIITKYFFFDLFVRKINSIFWYHSKISKKENGKEI